jgi:predicted dehydrogenase
MKPVTVVIVGAGGRGSGFANYILQHPEEGQVVGVAEPRDFYREWVALNHHISPENVFMDWQELAARERLADAVIITTQDRMHVGPAVALAQKGYQMLLEKPMAPDEAGCQKIVEAVKAGKIIFSVGHTMRYTRYTQTFKKLVESGLIGQLVSIEHLEPVGYWHCAHSFVRGNWRNEGLSSFMLLAKSCHDLDWIYYILGDHCKAISSFGSLQHFRKENAPKGAAARCLECAVEADCPYSARKIYLARAAEGYFDWPVNVLTPDLSYEGILEAVRGGPYGRCVYACDNDVVDHQVVNMEFNQGATAVFSMIGCSVMGHRKTRLFGTRGQLEGDGVLIHHTDFLTDKTDTIDTTIADEGMGAGHGGGDFWMMKQFLEAVAKNDPTLIFSGPDDSLESHRMVFAAEKARRENRVISMTPYNFG